MKGRESVFVSDRARRWQVIGSVLVLSLVAICGCGGQNALNKRFLQAAKSGTFEQMKKALSDGAKINCKNYIGATALHLAVGERNKKKVLFLIEKGADLGLKMKNGMTPTDLAAMKKDEDMVVLLEKIERQQKAKRGK